MAKIDLTTLVSGFQSTTGLNTNFQAIEDELNNKVLYRNPPSGEPNQMLANIDLNSNKVINAADGINNADYVTVRQLNASITGTGGLGVVVRQIETKLGSDADGGNKITLGAITYTPGANNLDVYENGVRLRNGVDYTETSGSEVTFTYDVLDTSNLDFITNTTATSTTLDASGITYTPAGTGAVATTVQAKLREWVSVKDFGAVGDGVTDDTAAIQAAFDTQDLDGWPRRVIFPHGIYLVTGLNLDRVNATHFIAERDLASATPSTIKYASGASGTGAVISRSTTSGCLNSIFENLIIDTNDTAQYGFYLASVGSFQSIKGIEFRNTDIENLKAGAVGWQLGDQTNTGQDTDAFNYIFKHCTARGDDALGWVIDAQNAYNIAWYNCLYSRKSGTSLFMRTGIKTIRGDGFRVYNFFGDELTAGGTPWVIDHNTGSMEIYGLNTEDYRVIKARGIGRDTDRLVANGVNVNHAAGDGGTSIDSTVVTSLRDCTLLTTSGGTYDRKVTCSNYINAENVELGSTGVWDLTGEARRNTIEGLRAGLLTPKNINPIFQQYAESTTAPVSWRELKGTGTGTITLSGSNNINGTNTVEITNTVANVGDPFGINFPSDIPVSAYQGQAINIVALATRAATESVDIECLVDGANVMTGGGTILETAASGGQVLAWGRLDLPTDAIVIDSLKVGISSNQTGTVWLDAVALIPLDFTGITPALFYHMRSLDYDFYSDREFTKFDNITTRTDAGAINTSCYLANIVTTGAAAVTLANGYEGQELQVIMTLDGGAATVTPANLWNGTTITFDDVGDAASLKFLNGKWAFMGGSATLA